MPLRILADENIPLASDAFGTLGTVDTAPGRALGADDVRDVDVLLVRSVTRVDASLLDDSRVRFVGSATIGTDHVDRDYLRRTGIAFAHAPASNADSVADYVVSALLYLATGKRSSLNGLCLGIVGVGNIGARIARRAPFLGVDVLLNDPPRQVQEQDRPDAPDFVPLSVVLDRADVVTLHVPLTTSGPHPTRHLIDADALARMKPGAWLINTARGPVVDNAALRDALAADPRGAGQPGADRGGPTSLGGTVLDVWEDEPTPDVDLLRRVDVATPHVAGYAFDGKVRGTRMLYDALCDHLDAPRTWSPDAALAPASPGALRCTPPDPRLPRDAYLHALASQVYDVADDDARLRPIADCAPDDRGAFFSRLRKTYPTRREMQTHAVPASAVPEAHREAVAGGLGIALDDEAHRGETARSQPDAPNASGAPNESTVK